MRKSHVLCLTIICLYSISGFAVENRDQKVKPKKFPQEALNLVEDKMTSIHVLDTAYLLSSDFTKFTKEVSESSPEFKEINKPELHNYFNFLYAKDILLALEHIETETDNEELKKNLIFKIEVQLKNHPISKADLLFAYLHWDLNQVN